MWESPSALRVTRPWRSGARGGGRASPRRAPDSSTCSTFLKGAGWAAGRLVQRVTNGSHGGHPGAAWVDRRLCDRLGRRCSGGMMLSLVLNPASAPSSPGPGDPRGAGTHGRCGSLRRGPPSPVLSVALCRLSASPPALATAILGDRSPEAHPLPAPLPGGSEQRIPAWPSGCGPASAPSPSPFPGAPPPPSSSSSLADSCRGISAVLPWAFAPALLSPGVCCPFFFT